MLLKKALSRGEVAEHFAVRGFVPQGAQRAVRHRYLGRNIERHGEEDVKVRQWKSKYCVWTHLGDWVSEECRRSRQDLMVSNAKSDRQKSIDDLISNANNSDWRRNKREIYLDGIDSVWSALEIVGVSAAEYFESTQKGVNVNHYGTQFDRKITADYLLAHDKSFRERYVNGYEFPNVPRFRQDAPAWQDFTWSWCESIAQEAKRRSRSLVMKACREALEPERWLSEMTPEEICHELRVRWSSKNVGDKIWAVWPDDGWSYPGKLMRLSRRNGQLKYHIRYEDGTEIVSDKIMTVGDYITGYFKGDM